MNTKLKDKPKTSNDIYTVLPPVRAIRLYFSINNRCNVNCPFCAMYSGTNKNTFLLFNKYKEIIDSYDNNFELQIEGGEPLLNNNLYLFLEYARSTKRCNKIIISTNGILLKNHLQRITDFISFSKIQFEIKVSINYYLYEKDNNIFKRNRDLWLATEFIKMLKITFNVRLRNKNKDKWIIDKLKKYKIYKQSNIYELQQYGKLTDKTYSLPFIKQNIDEFYLFSTDGINFNHDLIKRSNHEKNLK